MAQLPIYQTLEEKAKFFREFRNYRIDSAKEFDSWYKETVHAQGGKGDRAHEKDDSEFEQSKYDTLPYIFRGVGDAKYKILSSAQRLWTVNNMHEWANKDYLEFIQDLIDKARKLPLLDKVFKYYRLAYRQRDFPIMSILQHYGAPTPLIDWTYNLNVALYFATEYCTPSTSKNDIDQYFSVYMIDRSNYENKGFSNILEFHQGSFPMLQSFYDLQYNSKNIYYLSDFEKRYSKKSSKGFQDQRPLTILFNQRIIPQEGLFIFNPSPTNALENTLDSQFKYLHQIICVNIHKDLSEFVRRKIKVEQIDAGLIYPNLEKEANQIKEEVLYDLVKPLFK